MKSVFPGLGARCGCVKERQRLEETLSVIPLFLPPFSFTVGLCLVCICFTLNSLSTCSDNNVFRKKWMGMGVASDLQNSNSWESETGSSWNTQGGQTSQRNLRAQQKTLPQHTHSTRTDTHGLYTTQTYICKTASCHGQNDQLVGTHCQEILRQNKLRKNTLKHNSKGMTLTAFAALVKFGSQHTCQAI